MQKILLLLFPHEIWAPMLGGVSLVSFTAVAGADAPCLSKVRIKHCEVNRHRLRFSHQPISGSHPGVVVPLVER